MRVAEGFTSNGSLAAVPPIGAVVKPEDRSIMNEECCE